MTGEELHRIVREAVLATGRVASLGPGDDQKDLARLGLDSMAALDIITDVEDRLGVIVDDRQALRLRTIEAIAAYLATLAAPTAPAPSPAGPPALVLSTATFPCLSSHDLLGRLLLPLALAQELLVEAFCARHPADAVELVDLRVERPLIVPRDGERGGRLTLTDRPDGSCDGALGLETGPACFAARLRTAGALTPLPGRLPAPARWLGAELYEGLLPHGEHLRCRFGPCTFGPDLVELHLEEQSRDRELIAGRPGTSLRTRPVLIDGLLQACGLHALRSDGVMTLPERIAVARLDLRALGMGGPLECRVRRTGVLRYDVSACAADGSPALELTGVALGAVGAVDTAGPRARLESLLAGGGWSR